MYTIILNDKEFSLSTYTRQTRIVNGQAIAQAQLFIINTESTYDDLLQLAQSEIQLVQIKNDNTIIYNNPHYNAFITQFDESFIGEQIMLNVFFVFNREDQQTLGGDSYASSIQF